GIDAKKRAAATTAINGAATPPGSSPKRAQKPSVTSTAMYTPERCTRMSTPARRTTVLGVTAGVSGTAPVYPPAMAAARPLWELTGRSPGEPALEDARRQMSWRELDERTNAVGHGIESSGLEPGAHVALVAGNRAEFVEVVLGAQRAGMVVTPLKTSWTPDEIDVGLENAGTRRGVP